MIHSVPHPSWLRLPPRCLVALALALTFLGVSHSPPADASAGGYAYWGGFHVTIEGQSIRIPAGQLFHYISGSGYRVSWDGANYISLGPLCDTSMLFTYGYGAYQYRGSVHWGCSMGNQWKYNFGGWRAPRGDACAELWAKDWRVRVARQCHYIHG